MISRAARMAGLSAALWLACGAISRAQLSDPPSRLAAVTSPSLVPPQDYFNNQPCYSDAAPPWDDTTWKLQVLPDGLIYHAYLAGPKESRFASVWAYDKNQGWFWDSTLGGHVGILRWGTDHLFRPDGWQLDMEGAAFPRLDLENNHDLESADFRFGIPLTYGNGPWQFKFAYYHVSSHVGDEYMISHPTFVRNNYSRDSLVLGAAFYPLDFLRLYGEVGYGFYTSGPAKPWEFQFGAELSPSMPSGLRGAPFAAINGYIREEVDYSGSLTAQVGWQWRGAGAGQLFRVGVQYYNGPSNQYVFLNDHENYVAGALWYDF